LLAVYRAKLVEVGNDVGDGLVYPSSENILVKLAYAKRHAFGNSVGKLSISDLLIEIGCPAQYVRSFWGSDLDNFRASN